METDLKVQSKKRKTKMIFQQNINFSTIQKWMFSTFFISAIGLGILVVFTSGDIPRWDEWHTPGDYLLAKVQGTATFNNLFRLHNESRVIFAQLLTLFISDIWGWNQHIFHGINWAMLVGSAFFFIKIMGKTLYGVEGFSKSALLLLVSCICLIFTPVQYHNILYSGQIITTIIPCLLLAGIYLNLKANLPIWIRYSCAAFFSLIASFSFINGLMLWFLLWPAPFQMIKNKSIRINRSEIIASSLYFIVTTLIIFVFFVDYHKPHQHPSLDSGLLKPSKTLFFLSTFLAGPIYPELAHEWYEESNLKIHLIERSAFSNSTKLIKIIGVLLIVYLVGNWRAFTSWEMTRKIYPFMVLLAYSLVSGLAIAVARVDLGVYGNLSRYATVAIPAYLGIAGVISCIGLLKQDNSFKLILPSLVATFSLMVGISVFIGAISCLIDKRNSLQHRLSMDLRHIVPNNPLLTKVHPIPPYFTKMASDLESFGILKAGPSFSWIKTTEPEKHDEITYKLEIFDYKGTKVIKGCLFSNFQTESGDFLILSDLMTKSPITAILPPSFFNYPGLISTKDFNVRLDLIPNENLKSENCELFLAKSSSKQIWRLKLAE